MASTFSNFWVSALTVGCDFVVPLKYYSWREKAFLWGFSRHQLFSFFCTPHRLLLPLSGIFLCKSVNQIPSHLFLSQLFIQYPIKYFFYCF